MRGRGQIRVGERVGESDPDETSSMFSKVYMLALPSSFRESCARTIALRQHTVGRDAIYQDMPSC